MYLKTKKVARN